MRLAHCMLKHEWDILLGSKMGERLEWEACRNPLVIIVGPVWLHSWSITDAISLVQTSLYVSTNMLNSEWRQMNTARIFFVNWRVKRFVHLNTSCVYKSYTSLLIYLIKHKYLNNDLLEHAEAWSLRSPSRYILYDSEYRVYYINRVLSKYSNFEYCIKALVIYLYLPFIFLKNLRARNCLPSTLEYIFFREESDSADFTDSIGWHNGASPDQEKRSGARDLARLGLVVIGMRHDFGEQESTSGSHSAPQFPCPLSQMLLHRNQRLHRHRLYLPHWRRQKSIRRRPIACITYRHFLPH